jgi:putative transposase
MTRILLAFLSWFGAFFGSRHDLGLELVALRQQVGVLKRKNPRPRLSLYDRLFWLGLRRGWSKWASVLVVVKPETVVGGHRAGFRGYGRFFSRRRPGRPKITTELRHLIRSMAEENPTWGAPRIHGELLQWGFDISESTVSRYLAQGTSPPDSSQRWLTFLKNHREAIAAMDFFTVPPATFRVRYCFFVIAHGRRKILHSTSPSIPPVPGSCRNCERPSQRIVPPSIWSSTATASSMERSRRYWNTSAVS